jgi:hypothetical protein
MFKAKTAKAARVARKSTPAAPAPRVDVPPIPVTVETLAEEILILESDLETTKEIRRANYAAGKQDPNELLGSQVRIERISRQRRKSSRFATPRKRRLLTARIATTGTSFADNVP